MTSSGISGTIVRPGYRLGPWGSFELVSVPVVLVNARSDLIEMNRSGLDVHPVEPFIWEITSAAVLLLMAPLVGRAAGRWRLLGTGSSASTASCGQQAAH